MIPKLHEYLRICQTLYSSPYLDLYYFIFDNFFMLKTVVKELFGKNTTIATKYAKGRPNGLLSKLGEYIRTIKNT